MALNISVHRNYIGSLGYVRLDAMACRCCKVTSCVAVGLQTRRRTCGPREHLQTRMESPAARALGPINRINRITLYACRRGGEESMNAARHRYKIQL